MYKMTLNQLARKVKQVEPYVLQLSQDADSELIELVDSESRRIVKGEAMQSIILELKKDVEYLESKIEETLKSLHNLQKESILRKLVQLAIKIKREMIKQDSLLQDIFSPHAYHYKRDSYYTAIPKYNR